MKLTSKNLIIDQEEIQSLAHNKLHDLEDLRKILSSAQMGHALSLHDAALLLNVQKSAWLEEIYDAAKKVKENLFGKRIVLFAPLYISNRCSNNCLYCGFRRDNTKAERKTLTIEEIIREASFLSHKGYRRLLLVAGEDPSSSSLDYLCQAIEAINRETGIRIVHINAAPLSVEDFARLKTSGAGVYQCFQETYHEETYNRMHPIGPKQDYFWRLTVMDRAMDGGFDDIGMGALLGLYDYRFEVLSVIAHARHLEQRFGVGPHTISVPRLRPALGAALTDVPHPVSDQAFQKIVAVYRLVVPYAGVVVSTREGSALRDRVIQIGASQISAGSRTDIGGYSESKNGPGTSQFSIDDPRSLDETIRSIMQSGLLPSLCTSCYRSGRTGERFRTAAETGGIQDFCFPNALFSLMEYLQQHADEATRAIGFEKIQDVLKSVENQTLRDKLKERLEHIRDGEEDVHL